MRFDEALHILPGGLPIDGFDFSLEFTDTPFPINGDVLIFPWAGLVECRREQGEIGRGFS